MSTGSKPTSAAAVAPPTQTLSPIPWPNALCSPIFHISLAKDYVEIDWARYPKVEKLPQGKTWIDLLSKRGREPNTLDAYGRALNSFLAFLETKAKGIPVGDVTEEHIALWISSMRGLSGSKGKGVFQIKSGAGLSNATMQLRLSAVRLFYDYLLRKKGITEHPVPRGTFHPSRNPRGTRGILPRQSHLPWIPTPGQWEAMIDTVRPQPLRNRLMFCLAYEGAMRREELCSLEVGDLDLSHRLVRLRAETTKSKRGRILSYSQMTGRILSQYIAELKREAKLSGKRVSTLFPSNSNRNRGEPIGRSTWTKIVEGLAEEAGLPEFTTHTFRHLRLTDLARAGWETHEIMSYAGHRQIDTTMTYIHLSGRDLQERVARTTVALEAKMRGLDEEMAPATAEAH